MKQHKLKIALFSDVFYPTTNGIVSYIVTLIKELSIKGHKIYLFVPKSKLPVPKNFFNNNVKIHYYRGIKAFFYPDFKFTNILSFEDISLFKKLNPDLVFFQSPFTIGLKGVLLSKIFKKPLVGVFHTRIAHKDYISNLGKFSKKINLEKIAWKYVNYFYKNCDVIISPSEDIRKELYKYKINKNIITINNFINTSELKNSSSNIFIENNSFVYLGRLALEKNLYCLLKGFELVLKIRKDAHLYIIGDGPLFSDLEVFISKNNLKNNVHLLGRIDRKKIIKTDLLSKFLGIVTMSNTEVQPISLIEAMFKGLPIIGPKTSGISELVKDNGILVKRDSSKELSLALLKILANPSFQKKLSHAAIRTSKNYDSKILINITENILKDVVLKNRKK
ncbi:MAG: glycosyltransferase [Candidatus Woesearchaeota archaeon]